ncbi:ArsR/SmtB family transcription factor [Catenuloplanes japonicus]|uniref:ArsR/SmtB family transcription factor n=1 Tax=Catenuloplanes japonicus TaxID=33876 RepID=UPI000B2CC278|nr:helix-turn-helix transcriptional regulator [Catenuloplanes japonicus]
MAGDFPIPEIGEVRLDDVLSALADPLRRGVVLDLMGRDDGEHPCSSFTLPRAKSTRTHHWRVLRQAGIVHQRDGGNGSFVRLRPEFGARFPGLLDAVRAAEPPATP